MKNPKFENKDSYGPDRNIYRREILQQSDVYQQSRQIYFAPANKFYGESRIPKLYKESLLDPERNRILAQAIDISNINTANVDDIAEIRDDFDGNFMYHGVNNYGDEDGVAHPSSEVIIDIAQSGHLQNARAHGNNNIRHHPGIGEGISWNFNGIGVLPGQELHIAGFLTSPKLTLGNKREKLTVPDDAAPYEVRQVADDKDRYNVSVDVEDTYFVCAQGDLKMWADIFAICKYQNTDGTVARGGENGIPKRILYYDESDIMKPKWVGEDSQDYIKFERALRDLIPEDVSTVSWDTLLGKKFIPDADMDSERPHRISRDLLSGLGRQVLKFGQLKGNKTAETIVYVGNWPPKNNNS